MGLDHLSIEDLPSVLAGPIVRRLTYERVAVWVATRTPGAVTLKLSEQGSSAPPATTSAAPARIGEHLYLTVLDAPGPANGKFEAGKTYEYWLESKGWKQSPDWAKLSYGGKKPSFVGLPTAVKDLRIAHGSCRKLHGGGRDALGVLDKAIEATPAERPHLMILTGDQIYADDVASNLMPRLREIATKLVAIPEQLFEPLPKLYGRDEKTVGFGLTPYGWGPDHLWTLAEYYAMYLLSWSPVLWPKVLPTWTRAAAKGTDGKPQHLAATAGKHAEPLTGTIWDERAENLEAARQALAGAVPRLLANCPSLMIFDDHEVTDDWNLDRDWARRAYGNEKGRRIVTNGLAAYTLFQHWGNVPERFAAASSSPERTVLRNLTWKATGWKPPWKALGTLLGVPAKVAKDAKSLRPSAPGAVRYEYSFTTKATPVQICVLDERTDRGFDAAGMARVAPGALDRMFPEPAAGTADGTITLLVAAAPVLGVDLMEGWIKPALVAIHGSGEQPAGVRFDNEMWRVNQDAHQALLDRIAEHRRVVILSGDVHYGFASAMEYDRLDDEQRRGKKSRAVQFTASAGKNADTGTLAFHVWGATSMRLGITGPVKKSGFDRKKLEHEKVRPGFTQKPVDALRSALPIDAHEIPADDFAGFLMGRMAKANERSTIVLSPELAKGFSLPPPHWTYEVTPLDDETVGATAKAAMKRVLAAKDWKGWDAEKSRTAIRELQAVDRGRQGKLIVGVPNVGLVDFPQKTSGGKTRQDVRQRLLLAVGPAEPPGGDHQKHEVRHTLIPAGEQPS